MQQARQIGLMLFSYANDHDQTYPDGQSSTEVFQKLLDGRYGDDPATFYVPLEGKTRPKPGQKLKPENVSFDVTSGIVGSTPDQIPVVFLTGYRVTYTPGTPAIPTAHHSGYIGLEVTQSPDFFNWLIGRPTIRYSDGNGIAVYYKGNMAKFMKAAADGAIPNFVDPAFKPDGIPYRQLTSDGSPP